MILLHSLLWQTGTSEGRCVRSRRAALLADGERGNARDGKTHEEVPSPINVTLAQFVRGREALVDRLIVEVTVPDEQKSASKSE